MSEADKYISLFLLISSLYNIILSLWGLGLMSNDCENLTLFSALRASLCISSGFSTFYLMIVLCNSYCIIEDYGITKEFQPNVIISLFGIVYNIIMLVYFSTIQNNISDCSKNTDNYKIGLTAGFCSNGICLVFCGGFFIKWSYEKMKKRNQSPEEKDKQLRRQQMKSEKEKKTVEDAREFSITGKSIGDALQELKIMKNQLLDINKGVQNPAINSSIQEVDNKIKQLISVRANFINTGFLDGGDTKQTDYYGRTIQQPQSLERILNLEDFKKKIVKAQAMKEELLENETIARKLQNDEYQRQRETNEQEVKVETSQAPRNQQVSRAPVGGVPVSGVPVSGVPVSGVPNNNNNDDDDDGDVTFD